MSIQNFGGLEVHYGFVQVLVVFYPIVSCLQTHHEKHPHILMGLNPLSVCVLYSITRLVQLQMRFYVFDFSKIAKERDSVPLKQIMQS